MILSALKFTGIVLFTAILGAVIAFLFGLITGQFVSGSWESLGILLLSVIAGYLLGNIAGIILVKRILSFGSTLFGILGCVTGIIIAVAVLLLVGPEEEHSWWISIFMIPLLGTAGLYLKS